MPGTFVFVGNMAVGHALTDNLVAAGFTAAERLDDADVVLTFCTSQDSLEDVYFDSDGVIAKAQPGALLIDLSATTPSFAKELNAMAAVSDQHAVEAPLYVRDITLPDAFASKENLVALVGSEDDDFEVAEPYLAAIASEVDRCGKPGSGQLMKCSFTLHQVSALVALMESDALCRVSVDEVTAALSIERLVREQVATPSLQRLFGAIMNKEFASTYSVEVMMCELESALAAADDIDLIIPQAEAAEYLLQLLSMIGGMDMSPSALSLVYGDESASAQYGLDWSRAEEAYATFGDIEDDDDYDDYDDDDDHAGHKHHHGFGPEHGAFGGGFDGYSTN